ncbi:riboflavin synthase [Gorillibacterium massiliense]|uniref:riboflavin synthase n=1 Tax=Gorillibacterium massiliense TaxID=1280390 RepID=UPI0004ADEAC1|nr:riboflavin synthase [Gorillibacterium massiliense]
MFTGIIEEIGNMKRIHRQGQAMILTVSASKVLEDCHLGDSIAVNGVCLTVIAFDRNTVSMDVMPETYRKTNLRNLQPGDRVNLERAMAAGGRYGGHMVQGHVDTSGTIRSKVREENAVVYTIQPDASHIMKFIVSQGSIAVDGISLTVVKAGDESFTISIIPHTLDQTILADKEVGDAVNLEADILGKYIDRLLHWRGESPPNEGGKKDGKVDMNFLAEHGFV